MLSDCISLFPADSAEVCVGAGAAGLVFTLLFVAGFVAADFVAGFVWADCPVAACLLVDVAVLVVVTFLVVVVFFFVVVVVFFVVVVVPEASEPDTSEPETSEPDTSEPETSDPETSEPEGSGSPSAVATVSGVTAIAKMTIKDIITVKIRLDFIIG